VLAQGLRDAAKKTGVPFTTNHVGSMFGAFFLGDSADDKTSVTNYQQVMACNIPRFNQFFHGMLNEGVYLAPASYEAGFLSSMHSVDDIAFTIAAAERVLRQL